MMEHTPTPWTCGLDDGYAFGDEYVPGSTIEDDKYTLAIVLGDVEDLPHEANAAFIVKAVNSHDELVAALIEAKRMLVKEGYLPLGLTVIDAALSRAVQS